MSFSVFKCLDFSAQMLDECLSGSLEKKPNVGLIEQHLSKCF